MTRKQKTVTYLCPEARHIVKTLAKANDTTMSKTICQLILSHASQVSHS